MEKSITQDQKLKKGKMHTIDSDMQKTNKIDFLTVCGINIKY